MSKSPRISANDLARYLISKPTTQISIVRAAKYPNKPPLIRYSDARRAIVEHLSDISRPNLPLVAAEHMLKQRATDPSESALRQDDATKSVEVLHSLKAMSNQLAPFNFLKAPTPQSKLLIAGVEISVFANFLTHGQEKGVEQIGAAMLRMTQDDTSTDAAKLKRKQMGLYVATMLRLHVDQNISSNRTTANRLCMSIDVQHGEAFIAPKSNTQRIKDITSACQLIAALWPTV